MKISNKFIQLFYTFLFICILPKTEVHAFETHSHAWMILESYQRSSLAQTGTGSVVNRLGLERLEKDTPFNAYWLAMPGFSAPAHYRDNVDNDIHSPQEFEHCQMQELLKDDVPVGVSDLFKLAVEPEGSTSPILPIQNWLVRGVIREDDLGPIVTQKTYFNKPCGMFSNLDSGALTRVVNHFYDPIHDTGLDVGCVGTCQKSVDWALGYVDSFAATPQADANRKNHYSYVDAREAFWRALTEQIPVVTVSEYAQKRKFGAQRRMQQWATTFRALADVVHLVQDTAQPQHTRDDPHSSFQTPQQQAFEVFTNARVKGIDVRNGDGNEVAYVRSFFGGGIKNAVIAPPDPGTYPTVMFGTPLRFFTTRNDPAGGFGLADYTNRGFFTAGTLPGTTEGNSFPLPLQPVNTANGYTAINVPCALFIPITSMVTVACTHYTHTVPDTINPGYVDVLPAGFTAPNAPIVSDSIFTEIKDTYGVSIGIPSIAGGKALALEEMTTMANMTMPRAIAYGAGLLNYFFRGELTIEMPPAGLYAILDHAGQHSVDADGYPRKPNGDIFGFSQVQIKVKNTTPTIVESGTSSSIPQTAKSGQLVLVAQYHRYLCYKPDLSGQPSVDLNTGDVIPAVCSLNPSRSEYPEIAVSAPVSVDASGQVTSNGVTFNLNGSSGLAQFDFSADPIPINATDLFLQVVYRGKLGDEQDGIAVGRIDVSEPTYNMNANLSDMFVYQNQWLTQGQVTQMIADQTLPMGIEYQPSNLIFYQQCIDGKLVAKTGNGQAANQGIPPASIVRYAGIFDLTQQHTVSLKGQYWKVITNSPGNLQSGSEANGILPYLAQADKEKDPGVDTDDYPPSPYRLGHGRGVILGTRLDSFYKTYQLSAGLSWMPPTNFQVGPNGFLPVAMDQVYLTSQACP